MPYFPKQLESKSCYAPANLSHPWNTYEWQPYAASWRAHQRSGQQQKCRWDDWNAEEFCDLAVNQTIAMVGDSLTLKYFLALVHMLLGVTLNEEVSFTENIHTFEYNVCPHNATKITLYRNNHLWLKGRR